MSNEKQQDPSAPEAEHDSREPTPTPDLEPTRPHLRIVRGNPTPEELAALVTVVASMTGAAEPGRRPPPAWAARHRAVRRTLPHGPGAWRASALPG